MTHHALATDYALEYGRNVISLAAHRMPSKPLAPETASRRVWLELYFPWRVTVHSAVPAGTQARVTEQRLRDAARTINQRHLALVAATPKAPPERGPGHDYRKTHDLYEQAMAAWCRNYTCKIRRTA